MKKLAFISLCLIAILFPIKAFAADDGPAVIKTSEIEGRIVLTEDAIIDIDQDAVIDSISALGHNVAIRGDAEHLLEITGDSGNGIEADIIEVQSGRIRVKNNPPYCINGGALFANKTISIKGGEVYAEASCNYSGDSPAATACLYSKDWIIVEGGTLITEPLDYGTTGVYSEGELTFNGGTTRVIAHDGASAIASSGTLRFNNGSIVSEGGNVSAFKNVVISGGQIIISCNSMIALSAGNGAIDIFGGDITVTGGIDAKYLNISNDLYKDDGGTGGTTHIGRRKSIENSEITLQEETAFYNGEPRTIKVNVLDEGVLLTDNIDYALSYENNTEIGTAKVIVSGIGHYCGQVIKEFEIVQCVNHKDYGWTISKMATCTEAGSRFKECIYCGFTETETIPATGHIWDETSTVDKAPTCTEKGAQSVHCKNCFERKDKEEIPALGHDYIDWVTLIEPTYNSTGMRERICYRCDYIEKEELPILDIKSITEAKITGIKAKVFTGSAIKQKPVVKLNGKSLKVGTDYKLTYSNNKKVGLATVTITGINAYMGSIKKTFRINPKPTAMKSVVAAKKGFTAKWTKKTTQTTGYQLQYSTSSTFKSGNKTLTISKNSTGSKKVSKLKAKKKYYVRVRTYKTVNGTKYYSAWSAKKSVTTKK